MLLICVHLIFAKKEEELSVFFAKRNSGTLQSRGSRCWIFLKSNAERLLQKKENKVPDLIDSVRAVNTRTSTQNISLSHSHTLTVSNSFTRSYSCLSKYSFVSHNQFCTGNALRTVKLNRASKPLCGFLETNVPGNIVCRWEFLNNFVF